MNIKIIFKKNQMNKIIDFHTHIFPDHIAPKIIDSIRKETGFTPSGEGTLESIKREMRRSQISISVALAVATSPQLTRPTNDWIIRQRDKDLIPIGSIHPLIENFKLELKLLKEAGIKGIKFNSIFQNIRPDDERIFPLYEEIMNHEMFMIFHSGKGLGENHSDEILSTPERISKLLNIFPKIRIVAAHFGGYKMIEESKKYLLGKDVYFDTSYPPGLCFQQKDLILYMINHHDPDRILFGTDTPFARQKEDVEYILNLPISEDLKEKILYKNGERLLGLERT
jgi:predicted TIM-barrel fold metal-dependent hydrolase